MRIAIVGYEANVPNRVGSNQYAFELMKAIYRLDRKNRYTIYLPRPPLSDLPKERKNWQYQIVGPSKLWNIFGLPRALFLQRPRPDVVFSPGHYSPLFFSVPLVVSVMDLGYLRFPEQFTKPILLKLKFWTSFSIGRAKHILAISDSTKDDIIRHYGLNSDKITVTYPGYDREKFSDQYSAISIQRVKRKYGIKGDYVLFLGTLKPSKNIEGLLEAFKTVISDQDSGNRRESVASHRLPITLVIAGKKGWMYQRMFEKVKKLGLEKQIVFAGFVDEADVLSLMKGAKVFVLPSFWEGFGIPVIEAMACGTPVIVSKVGSLPEVVGEAGIVVDPSNQEDIARGIKKVIDDTVLHETLRKRGLKQAEKFNWEKCAKKTLAVLEAVGKGK